MLINSIFFNLPWFDFHGVQCKIKKLINISLILRIHVNFSWNYNCNTYYFLYSLYKVLRDFNWRMYKNFYQIKLMKFTILFLIFKFFFFLCFEFILSDILIFHRFITKIRFCFSGKTPAKIHINLVRANIMFQIVITCVK